MIAARVVPGVGVDSTESMKNVDKLVRQATSEYLVQVHVYVRVYRQERYFFNVGRDWNLHEGGK